MLRSIGIKSIIFKFYTPYVVVSYYKNINIYAFKRQRFIGKICLDKYLFKILDFIDI